MKENMVALFMEEFFQLKSQYSSSWDMSIKNAQIVNEMMALVLPNGIIKDASQGIPSRERVLPKGFVKDTSQEFLLERERERAFCTQFLRLIQLSHIMIFPLQACVRILLFSFALEL